MINASIGCLVPEETGCGPAEQIILPYASEEGTPLVLTSGVSVQTPVAAFFAPRSPLCPSPRIAAYESKGEGRKSDNDNDHTCELKGSDCLVVAKLRLGF